VVEGRSRDVVGRPHEGNSQGVRLDYAACHPSSVRMWWRYAIVWVVFMSVAGLLLWAELEFRRRFYRGGSLVGARPIEMAMCVLAAAFAGYGTLKTHRCTRVALALAAGVAVCCAILLAFMHVPYRDR
jgi:hypothetical protein